MGTHIKSFDNENDDGDYERINDLFTNKGELKIMKVFAFLGFFW
jgi:hypothetical protein